jgi:superfamily II DNA/RNA helicase/very-short-patch-repair endonuclease
MESKNIFDLHKDILNDYKLYIDSFINIADPKILKKVEAEFESDNLYPLPLIQFNPSFESGGKVEDLISREILVEEFNNIFYDETGKSWGIYKHQAQAIEKGNEGKSFVVTSGTGSGKSLTYISTIFNYLFKNSNSPGIKAIIVYPLNALINSQEAALVGFEQNYKKRTGRDLPFTFAKYTGQEKGEAREKVIANPPDILLTNYMMLELLMVRKTDEDLRKSFLDNLKFLVYDELHVYKGRQGADVSLLNRRIKACAKNKNIICIGTSATMATGSVDEQKTGIAKVASRFFDTKFYAENVIIESLTYSTEEKQPTVQDLQTVLNSTFSDRSRQALIKNQIAIWLERTVALKTEGEYKRRNDPQSLQSIAKQLSTASSQDVGLCEKKIVDVLIWAESINIQSAKERKKDTILPFKLHQFISQTGYVYVTLEPSETRFITLDPNPFIKLGDVEIPVYQTVFSRVTGYEFICVRKDYNTGKLVFRDFNENQNPKNDDDLKTNDGNKVKKVKSRVLDDYKDGYVIFDKGFALDINEFIDLLPSSWLTKAEKIDPSKDFLLPKEIYVLKDGAFSINANGGEKAWFIPAPLIYDPTCGLIYLEPKLSEKSKLISLGNEGRSTSTTLITLQTLLALYKHGKVLKEQKLMSFTDNRQDASLQSGHFNDFIQVVHLRSAIEKVLKSNEEPLKISDLIFKVQEALQLPESDYATNPAPNPNRPNEENLEALRNYISYRIIQDLKRGWRYVLPNLEQTALLEITYKNLDKDVQDETLWGGIDLLKDYSFEKRKEFLIQILNYFRNMYAVDFDMLRYENRLRVESELNQQLNKEKLWSLDKGEHIEAPSYLSIGGADKAPREVFIKSIGPSSRLARYIKHEFRNAKLTPPDRKDYLSFMEQVLDALAEAHYLKKASIKAEKGDKDAYQLILSKVLWKKGDQKNVEVDKTSFITLDNEIKIKPHRYFQKLYQEDFSKLPKSYIAAEHTGQIKNEQKIEREEKFNDAIELSALYCSPTMELGIDISSLNIVHMRNVPPSPANYAQRSGRAGRSGQSALVFTYASKVSPHDKHYFSNPVKMVAGVVQAPRIDLTNEELIRSHVNATVLSFLNAEEFKPSLIDLIDISGKTYRLKSDVKAKYQDIVDSSFDSIKQIVLQVVANIDFSTTKWFTPSWIDNQIKTVPEKLDNALLRWRKMYLDTLRQMNEAHETHISPIIKDNDIKKLANISYMRAKDRKSLLENQSDKGKNSMLSEFYTFRYLASEGFLPGYNFTRLPIRVFLGGKDRNESISRPRFIGLKEFGPNNLIYHNGGKFKVNRITPNDVALELTEIKISTETHYAFLGKDEGKGKNQDPITGSQFTASNIELHRNLLELEEAQSENSERISCMEEVRTSEGYVTELYLNTTDSLSDASKIRLTVDGDEIMKIFYAPAANLILLNKKWKRGKDDGFDIGSKSGFFKTKKQLERPSTEDPAANVMLYTYDTSDILYIQPVKSLGLSEEGVTSLQYALEKAVEVLYNIEPVEIDARLMGSQENKNIMLYESAEGSIGVLKDIARNPSKLKDIFLKAYEICGYDIQTKQDKYPERAKASYDDLLSYYNQIDHTKINRHSIITALELLISVNPDDTIGGTYEGKYEDLKKRLHHKSPGEKDLLDFLFQNGFRLPDFTNHNMEQFYVQPDFVYEKEKALIFVDGGIHKRIINKADDAAKRKAIELAGFDVLVWDYTSEHVESFVTRRQDIFRKVR